MEKSSDELSSYEEKQTIFKQFKTHKQAMAVKSDPGWKVVNKRFVKKSMLMLKLFLILSCDYPIFLTVCRAQDFVSGDMGNEEAGAGSQVECCGVGKGQEPEERRPVRGAWN